MSFYHILLSSAAKGRFPNNHAAQFSIPIDDAQQLTGDWEVAIAQLSYSNCLYTFNHETVTIQEKRTSAHQTQGCRVIIPRWPKKTDVIAFIIDFVNKACQHIVALKRDKQKVSHHVASGWIVCVSPKLKKALGLVSHAMTSYDLTTVSEGNSSKAELPYEENAYFIDVITEASYVQKIVIKAKNADITLDTLQRRFNYLLQIDGQKIASLSYHNKTRRFTLTKKKNDDLVLVTSKPFHEFLRHHTAAAQDKNRLRFLPYHPSNSFENEWTVFLYRRSKEPVGGMMIKTIDLAPRMMRSIPEVVTYLNEQMNDSRVHVKAKDDVLTWSVGGRDVVVTLDRTLEGILGFDQRVFKSDDVIQATAPVSLSRRINYFQIYSNIGVNVRVGDTAAPLLSMIPYNPKDCSILSERHFKKLHYIPLASNYISHIDISIYDDAGVLIPFHKDAITSLALHFRRKL